VLLGAVARAADAAGDAPPFGPIVVVVPGDRVEALAHAAENTCERVLVVSDPGDPDGLELPAALVAPGGKVATIGRWTAAGVPVIAWGVDEPWPVRMAAVEAGARIWLSGPIDLDVALEQARWATWLALESPVAVVLGGSDALADALAADGIRLIPPDEPLDAWSPDAAVVAGPEAEAMLPAIRSHPGWSRTAVLALADHPVPGADEVLPPDASLEAIRIRLRCWLERVRSVPVDRDPLTGVANRPAALRRIDRWLAWGRRAGTPLSLGLIALNGLAQLRAGQGLTAEYAVHRATVDALGGTLRRLDVIGRIGPSLYVAGLPSCRADEARKRLVKTMDVLRASLASDPRAAGIVPVLGLADTAHATDRLLARAWESLANVRQGA